MKERETQPEQIAELLDGRLPEPERSELLARLAASDEFRELLETAAVLREAEEEGAGEPPVLQHAAAGVPELSGIAPPPSAVRTRGWRSRPARWLTLAAVLALAVLAPALWRRGGASMDDPNVPVSLLTSTNAGLQPGWSERPPWTSSLSVDDPLDAAARAVRAGALHTGLLLALRGGDAGQAARVRDQLIALLKPVPGAASVEAGYRGIGSDSRSSAERLESAGEELARVLGADDVLWGAWLEAARVAAARQDVAFFRAHQSRAVLRRAAKSGTLSESARATAMRLRTSLGGQATLEWPGVQRNLDELLRDSAS